MLGAPDADYINANYIDVSAAPSFPRAHPIQVSLSLSLSGKAGNKWDLRWLGPAEYSGREEGGEVSEHDRGGRWSGQR